MKITTAQLRRIIREELTLLREGKGVNVAALEKILMRFDSMPDKNIPPNVIKSVGIDVKSEYTYHAVYGQLVAQLDGDDVEYWSNEHNSWKRIDYEDRQHPVSIHSPK
jgi:hypothetical protein